MIVAEDGRAAFIMERVIFHLIVLSHNLYQ